MGRESRKEAALGSRVGDMVVSFGKWVCVCGEGGGSEFCDSVQPGVISGNVMWRSSGPLCPGKV